VRVVAEMLSAKLHIGVPPLPGGPLHPWTPETQALLRNISSRLETRSALPKIVRIAN
jgi:hypothetical protein